MRGRPFVNILSQSSLPGPDVCCGYTLHCLPCLRAASCSGVRGRLTPIMQSRVTSSARASSLQPSVPAGRMGRTRYLQDRQYTQPEVHFSASKCLPPESYQFSLIRAGRQCHALHLKQSNRGDCYQLHSKLSIRCRTCCRQLSHAQRCGCRAATESQTRPGLPCTSSRR
jgi:hypothetical protein